jgi:hypothetical protein
LRRVRVPAARPLRYIAAATAISAALLLTYGRGLAGYDAAWAMVWGRELAHGHWPHLAAASTAPTPHPLANLIGAALSPLGDDALPAFQLVVLVAAGALGVACFALGKRLFTPAVGVLFAAIVLTRGQLVVGMLLASTDVVFLALVIAAAALEAAQPRRGTLVQVLLALAGLLRPEAWVLAAAYAVWLRPRGAQITRVAACAVVAPVVWIAFDLVATGDLLFSLHGTRTLAETLDRPRGVKYAFASSPTYLSAIIPPPLIYVALAGWILSAWLMFERSVLPIALALAGLICYLTLGVAGLPILSRYLLLPAVMLALFAGVSLAGWRCVPSTRARRAWATGAAASLVLVAITVAGDRTELDRVTTYAHETRATQDSLHSLTGSLGSPPCRPVRVVHFRMRPLVAYWLEVEPGSIHELEDRSRGVLLTPRASRAAASYFFDAPPITTEQLHLLHGRRSFARNALWAAEARCGQRFDRRNPFE